MEPSLTLHALAGTEILSVQLDLSESWKPGVQELGDVVLPPTPVLVAGVVVDATGHPVGNAHVLIRELADGPFRASSETTTESNGQFALPGFLQELLGESTRVIVAIGGLLALGERGAPQHQTAPAAHSP